ncbi:hypothetical protein Bca4012_082975 [Brassica carinata]
MDFLIDLIVLESDKLIASPLVTNRRTSPPSISPLKRRDSQAGGDIYPSSRAQHRKDLHPNLERTKIRSGQIYKPKSRLSYAQPRQKSRRRSKQVPQHQPTPRRFGGFNFFRAAYAYRPGLELRDRRAKQKKQEGEEGEPPATPSGGRS